MNCTDFLFDNEYLSNYGMMVCSFDSSDTAWSGGDISFTTIKAPDSNRQSYCTHTYEQPLSCTFSICKNPSGLHDAEEQFITQEEYSALSRFLKRTDGYHWLQFDAEGFEDIFFNCQISMQPHKIYGQLVGFDVTVTTDSPYGYSRLYKNTFDFDIDTDTNTIKTFSLENYSDKTGIIYPKTTITPKSNGTVVINSGLETDLHTTKILNCKAGIPITLDKDNDYFDGIMNPNSFNFVFPVLANSYDNGKNRRKSTFSLGNGSVLCTVGIEYRLVRMVTV